MTKLPSFFPVVLVMILLFAAIAFGEPRYFSLTGKVDGFRSQLECEQAGRFMAGRLKMRPRLRFSYSCGAQ